MKRPPEVPDLSCATLTPEDYQRINEQVVESVRFAKRREATAAGAESEARAAAVASFSPATNRGGKSETGEIAARLVLEDGKCLEIPGRRGWGGDAAFLDWVNFTTVEEDFNKEGLVAITDDDVMRLVSARCYEIFGFGIVSDRGYGANFYDRSYILGLDDVAFGLVCHGGQRGTVLVMLSGKGCAAAAPGWEKRLYDFLNACSTRARLTRIDLAHDIYDGKAYNVDKADQDFDAGLYNCGGRNPNHEMRGNWKRPSGKGRTLYIGTRENGKFCRVYEKGKQLGDKASEWVRVEVEYKSVNRQIPFDVLLKAGEYLAAAYPALSWVSERQERIVTEQKAGEITYKQMVEWLKKQCGAAINVMVEMEASISDVIEKIIRPGDIPTRLKKASFLSGQEYLHVDPPVPQLTRERFDAMALA